MLWSEPLRELYSYTVRTSHCSHNSRNHSNETNIHRSQSPFYMEILETINDSICNNNLVHHYIDRQMVFCKRCNVCCWWCTLNAYVLFLCWYLFVRKFLKLHRMAIIWNYEVSFMVSLRRAQYFHFRTILNMSKACQFWLIKDQRNGDSFKFNFWLNNMNLQFTPERCFIDIDSYWTLYLHRLKNLLVSRLLCGFVAYQWLGMF